MSENERRNSALDVIRIFAAVSVIFLHVTDPFISYPPFYGIQGTPWWILNIINVIFRTSVPLFVMISGLLLLDTKKKLDTGSFYKKRFAKIGIPTIIWITVYLLILGFTGQIASFSSLIERLLTLNLLHLYFLILILELYFITPLFYGFIKNNSQQARKILLVSTFALTTIVAGTSKLFPQASINLTTNLATVFIPFLFYYLLGPTLKSVKLSLSSVVSLVIALFYAVIVIAVISRGNISSYSRSFEGLPVMAISIITFLLFLQLNQLSFFTNERLKKILSYVSSLMFGMYLAHVLVLMLIDHFYPILPGNVGSPMWLIVLFKGGIVVILSFAFSALLRRLPFSKYITP